MLVRLDNAFSLFVNLKNEEPSHGSDEGFLEYVTPRLVLVLGKRLEGWGQVMSV